MSRKNINVKDFKIFHETLKAVSKIMESAKISINQNGLEIYGARQRTARCEVVSDSVTAEEPVEFSVENLQVFLKVVSTVAEAHGDDFSGLKFCFDSPFVLFESKKFKTKYVTCAESVIRDWISKKIQTEMTPVFEFASTPEMIKKLNGYSFMFSDPKSMRVYLETKPDMENNAVFATICDNSTDLNNEITSKFGLVTSGSLLEKDENGLIVKEKKIILDLERVNLFNAVPVDELNFQFMNLNCLVCKTVLIGKTGSFFNMTIYSTVLKD